MEFQTDIFEGVEPPSSSKYNLIDTKLPTSQDVYFVSKWHELFERYEMARIFLRKTEEENWDYWFNKVDDEVAQKGIDAGFISEEIFPAIVLVVLLVTIITPVLLKIVLSDKKCEKTTDSEITAVEG